MTGLVKPFLRAGLTTVALTGAIAISNADAQSPRDTIVKKAGAAKYAGGGTPVKELTIGDANGADEYLFSAITDVLLAKDGTIWILDVPEMPSNPPSLRVFDASGKYLRSVGGKGRGPGEFMGPTGMAQLPDGRVLLRDILTNRVNVYTPDGKPATTWTFTTQYSWPVRGRDGLRVDPAGITWLPFSVIDPNDRTKRTLSFLRVNGEGAIIDTVAAPDLPVLPRQSITITSPDGRGRTTLGPPYQAVANWFWHPGGYFATAMTDRYAIDLRSPSATTDRNAIEMPVLPQGSGRVPRLWKGGDPVISIRRDVAPVQIPEGERANRKAILEADVNARQGDRSGPIPEIPRTKPPIKGVTFGDDGRLWVSVAMPSERFVPEPIEPRPGYPTLPPLEWREPSAYEVFEQTGEFLGRVSLPAGTGARLIVGDVVWGQSRDSDGVNYLTKYRISWKK